jgi:thioredoxin 1
MANVAEVTDASFSTVVLESDVPVLVDFWAEWCAPCKAIMPHVGALAEENDGKLKVVKLDIQKNMKTAMTYKVSQIPALLVFKNGQLVDRKQGAGGGLPALRQLVGRHV